MKTTAISNIRDAAGRRIGVIVEDEVITIAGFTDKAEPVVWRPIRSHELYRLLGVIGPSTQITEHGSIQRIVNDAAFAIEVAFDSGGVCLYSGGQDESGLALIKRLENMYDCRLAQLLGKPITCVLSSVGAGYIVSISNPAKDHHASREQDHGIQPIHQGHGDRA